MSFLVIILFFVSIAMSANAFIFALHIDKERLLDSNKLMNRLITYEENTTFLMTNHEQRLRRTEDELFEFDN